MFEREIFAQRLKQLRTSKKLSMQQLTTILGFKSKASIGQFETARNIPSIEALVTLAEYFNVSTDYLLGLSDKPERR